MLLPLLQNNLLEANRSLSGGSTGPMGVSAGTIDEQEPVYTLSGGSIAPMGQSDGAITFTSVNPPAINQRPPIKHGGGAATWDETFIKRRREALAKDDEEIMIFVKEFLNQYGAD